jgi:hypothetical protein
MGKEVAFDVEELGAIDERRDLRALNVRRLELLRRAERRDERPRRRSAFAPTVLGRKKSS